MLLTKLLIATFSHVHKNLQNMEETRTLETVVRMTPGDNPLFINDKDPPEGFH